MSTRSRKIINLVDEKYDNYDVNKENTSEACDNVQNEVKRDSPLPSGANFIQEELSILDDIDLEDTDILLQNLPSNSSIFPNDIPEFSPTPDNKHYTEEPYNETGTLLPTNSSPSSIIADSQPNTNYFL
ncbi:uncharacterized protein LOC111354251 [Spodoptera litura]|uniref:Uncharacterized protein LOC111354251 n=1 Tax=Spodoptera litura TaxID=69820 RepID=A0A9J7E935_SPOLT|nr:uncharacterized protein LOC111354251 [Spodoptera litura]